MNSTNPTRFFDPNTASASPVKPGNSSLSVISVALAVLLLLSFAVSAFFYVKARNLSLKIPPLGCHYEEVQCIAAPCEPVLVCPSETTPTPEPTKQPTPTVIKTPTTTQLRTDFGSPKWLGKLVSISSLPVFKDPNTDKPNDNGMYLGKTRFYKAADLSKGAQLVDAFIPTEGMGITDTLIRLIKDGDKFYYLSRNLSQWERDNYAKIFKSDVTPLDLEFKEIHIPDYISADGKTYKALWASPDLFDTLKNPQKLAEIDFGSIYATYTDQSELPGVQDRSLYLKLKDTTLVKLDLSVPFFTDDRVPIVYFSDTPSTSNKIQYAHGLGFGKCGASAGLTIFKNDQDLLINKIKVGKDGYNGSGADIFQVKDPSSKLLLKLYENYKIGRDYPSAPPILSYDEFVTRPNHFVWKDTLGDWNIFLNSDYAPMAECGKPVIYLYPQIESQIKVQVAANMSLSEPKYPSDGWLVKAKPDGQLTFENRTFPYLFWEGQGTGLYPDYRNYGSVVSKDNLEASLKSQLSSLGLNAKETNDFLEFWLPRMPQTPFVRLTWLGTSDMDKLAPLSVTPSPDTQIRVFLEFEGLSEPIALIPQKLSSPPRKGFTLIEWGGLLYQSPSSP